MRLVKRIVIGFDQYPEIAVNELRTILLIGANETCDRMWDKVACWRDRTRCASYYNRENISSQERLLVEAYEWPSGRATAAAWWIYADKARLAIPAAGAAELVVTAIEAALASDHACEGPMAASFNHAVDAVRGAADGAAFEPRLQAIENACPKQR